MPASPSFPSERRGRWKRRRRGGGLAAAAAARKTKQQEEDDVEDEEEENKEEEDVEVDNGEEPPQPQQQQNGGVAAAAPDPGPGEGEVVEEGGERICDFPAVVRRRVIRPHGIVKAVAAAERENLAGERSSVLLALENVTHGQLQALSLVPADSPALIDQERNDGGAASTAAYVISPPAIMEGGGVVKRFGDRVHVVPMHSDWFSPKTVNRLERQVVPHFFSGKSPDHTPEKYMECRNTIVAKYMGNPVKRLTISDCEGLVDGVSNEDLTRIVRFLDHWGIINYCAAAQNHHEPCNDLSCVREDINGEVHVPSAALKSIDSLIRFERPKCRVKAADVYSSLSCSHGDLSDLDNRIREHLCENHCNYCSQPLPTMYYQSQKEGDVLLCPDCLHDGRFVTGHSSIDFVRVDSTKDYGDLDGDNWSDQETLLLLEALELYNENWSEIAEHVGTKTKAQCILHFLRLPVEDGLLENVDFPSTSKSSHFSNGYSHGRGDSNGDLPGSSIQDHDSDIKLPFAKSTNPVMALVAFLASAIGPRVAAACAHASLATLSGNDNLDASGREGSEHGSRMNSEGVHDREGSSHGDAQQQREENSRVQGSSSQNGLESTPLDPEKVKPAVRAGLAAAATKAKLFADHEEREIQRLSANIVNHQLKRLELKLKQFAEIETLLMKECEQVEKTRQRFAAERARMLGARFPPSGVASQVTLPGITPSMGNNTIISSNRQQPISVPSSSQPSISGYGTNQTVHPQMQFMQRQSAFSFGPRLPLNAIQTNASSTTPSNVMFSSPGNSAQPSFNHPMVRSTSGTSSALN